ncbi:uncharacterized protein TRAVEDRAFT_26807 [Trametes versicolor FP-101664 SS1]|uniref:uncharacterized protein n=1 Tax=Trametes versicolor (strain FP-101664) TaxID=717944 RepID=UPI0004623451|nr:uncharacterized protein TRAVEDRAFT_26807 [Trametes versicolor FP-101664 SS1]EIW63607.1 hypothetical protein TRAVEDRAFT_26807 [Trametes versicolor FP-101664 SS1]
MASATAFTLDRLLIRITFQSLPLEHWFIGSGTILVGMRSKLLYLSFIYDSRCEHVRLLRTQL